MPIIKSKNKKAFEHNIKAEMDAGKPQDQSLAIAYSVKRKAAHKKMAEGGMVNEAKLMKALPPKDETEHIMSPPKKEYMANKFAKGGMIPSTPRMAESSIIKASRVDALGRKIPELHEELPKAEKIDMRQDMPEEYADGGPVEEQTEDEYMTDETDGQPEMEADDEHHASIAAAIMARRHKMAEGGMVDLDENAEEEPNGFYAQNEHAALKENYDEDLDSEHQPMESNEHADSHEEHEENEHDMISQIRSQMKLKKRI